MAKSMSITTRYQVTVPIEVRRALRLSSKDSLVFNLEGNKVFVEKAPSLSDIQTSAQKLIKKRGVGQVSQQDMDRARDIFEEQNLEW